MGEVEGNDPDEAVSSIEDRRLACQLAAAVCHGRLPTGTTLLSYIVMFERYLPHGAEDVALTMGWDVVERPPVHLAEVRAKMRENLEGGTDGMGGND
jgi:hypothetical protein